MIVIEYAFSFTENQHFKINLVNTGGNRMDYKNGEKIVLNSCLDVGSLLAG